MENVDFEKVYTVKIINVKDQKISETNFKKILHNILPCGVNLLKWKKTESSLCDQCNCNETIAHLLLECNYSAQVWTVVNRALNIEVSLKDIVLGLELKDNTNMIVSIMVYLIYKEWLTLSFDGRVRNRVLNRIYFRNELLWYSNVYSKVAKLKCLVPEIKKVSEAFA